jgi:hypothetical protein
MKLSEQLKELDKQEIILVESLAELRGQIDHVKKQIWREENGLSEGDTVSFTESRVIKTGVIAELKGYTIRPYVRLHKKDGTLGERISRVWNQETLKKINHE